MNWLRCGVVPESCSLKSGKSRLPVIELFVEQRALSRLHEHLPQSGFDYVKGRIIINDTPAKNENFRYRGDFYETIGVFTKNRSA